MIKQAPADEKDRERTVTAVATFTTLMHAYERGELTVAGEAQRQLEQLGVVVRVKRPRGGVNQ